MQLLAGQWEEHFRQQLKEAKHDLLIISPFITAIAKKILRPILEERKIRCRVITRQNLQDFYSGVSDIDTIGYLVEAGVPIKSLKGLHAKVYLFDRRQAVVTSANFTSGGLIKNHEWGILLSREECPEVFQKADDLWARLHKVIIVADIASVKERIEVFKRKYPELVLHPNELLPDDSEPDTQNLPNGGGTIELRSTASATEVQTAWTSLANKVLRVANVGDYLRMGEELKESAGRRISVRSFLWLVGWCNTGKSCRNASERHLQPFAMTMFGYVPDEKLQLPGAMVNLKDYRYRQAVDETLHRAIVANHVNHLTD